MISSKNWVYVQVVGDMAGGRLLWLNNMEWRRGEELRMQIISARMSLDSIVLYVSMDLKLKSKKRWVTLRTVTAMGIATAGSIGDIAKSKKI